MTDKPGSDMKFDYSEAFSVFSDAVNINVGPENVVLGFAERDIADEKKAVVVAKVYMTIPHFLRMVDIFGKAVQHLKDTGTIVEGGSGENSQHGDKR